MTLRIVGGIAVYLVLLWGLDQRLQEMAKHYLRSAAVGAPPSAASSAKAVSEEERRLYLLSSYPGLQPRSDEQHDLGRLTLAGSLPPGAAAMAERTGFVPPVVSALREQTAEARQVTVSVDAISTTGAILNGRFYPNGSTFEPDPQILLKATQLDPPTATLSVSGRTHTLAIGVTDVAVSQPQRGDRP